MNSTFVNQVMNTNVLTPGKSTTLQEAAENMKKLNVGYVIITKNSNPIRIITERDFVTKIVVEGRPLFTEIQEVMSSPLIQKKQHGKHQN